MIEPGGALQAAAQAAAEAARRAAEAARRAAAEAARRAAAEAAQRAAEQAAQRAAAARDTNQAQGQQRLTTGVQETQQMADPPFEPTAQSDDLTIGGGRTRASGGGSDGDLSIGGGETEASGATEGAQGAASGGIQVEEEASTTEVSASEAADDARMEAAAERGDDAYMIRMAANDNRRLNDQLQAMSPEQRQQYDVVRRTAETAEQNGVASAVHDLEEMVQNGQMTPELTSQLNRIATQETASTLVAKDPNAASRVLGETIRQIAEPTAIQQDPSFETCGLNAMEQEFARNNPEGYAKFVADMVSQDFRATLPGDPLSDPPQPWEGVPLNLHQVEFPMPSGRSLTSTMFQQSIRAAYASNGEMANDPITADQFNEIMNDMNPNSNRTLVGLSPDQQAAAVGELQAGTIVVLNNYDPTGTAQANSHACTVTDISNGNVTVNDPYGQSYTMPVDQFQSELRGMVVDSSAANVQTDADGNETIGGGRIRVAAASAGDLSMGGGRTRFAAVAAGEIPE